LEVIQYSAGETQLVAKKTPKWIIAWLWL
jgi:hypothetical protein